jgi:hypothetical protein
VIRQILKLAVAAAKVEARRFAEKLEEATAPPGVPVPVHEPAPIPEPVVESSPASKWQSPTFHTETLKSTTCPDCGGAKRVGWYRCPKCVRGAS